jgi:beta-N-acetylhexosaminidase
MDIDFLKKKPFYLEKEAINWVSATLSSMTPKEKIGQLLVLNCLHSDEHKLKELLSFKPGAIHRSGILKQTELRKTVKYAAAFTEIPLLFSGDLEHGIMNPFNDDLMYQNHLGTAATGDPLFAEYMGTVTAKLGKSYGFNWSFTPDVDIILNFRSSITGTRTFGSNPDTILSMASAYIRGMKSAGMAGTLKHWPGDGVDERDQHLVTSNNTLTMEEWRNTFGRIYEKLISQGIKTIMSAHITLPAYDRELNPDIPVSDILPASINPRLNNNLLRNELGFNGLIISDATIMAGLTSQGPRNVILPMVIQNGCDMMLFTENTFTDISYLYTAYQLGRISKERLDTAVVRVLGFKASLGLHRKTVKDILNTTVPINKKERAKIELQSEVYIKNSITLVKDTQNIIPIVPGLYGRVLLFKTPKIPVFATGTGDFREILESRGFTVTEVTEEVDIDPDLFDLIIYVLNQFEFFGDGSSRIQWSLLHKGIVRGLRRYWDIIPTIMISLNNPFHLYEVPRVKTYINAYSSHEKILGAVGDMLIGKLTFKGGNPIDPFCSLDEAHL